MHGFKYYFLKLVFLNGKGPAAEGKAMGPSLKLEVDLRREILNTPCTRKEAADLKGFALCRRPSCKLDDLMS